MASRLRRYLRQTITIRRVSGRNSYDEPTYSVPEQIPGRYVEASGRSVNSLGVEVTNRDKVLMAAEMVVGDLVVSVTTGVVTAPVGATVESVEQIVGGKGTIIGYRVEL